MADILNVSESPSSNITSVLGVMAYRSFFPPGYMDILTLVDFIIIYTVISVFGIVVNLINIIVFIKMGPQDSVNISLLGLSISDFCFLLFTLLLSICYYPFWKNLDLNFNIIDLKMLTLGWPQFYFRRVSNWITAFITLERCICVVLPLKVKSIITPRRTVAILVLIHVIMALTVSPPYFSASYQTRYDTRKNRTLVVLVFHDNSAETDSISSAISSVLTVVTFIWVFVCTVILVVSLKSKGNLRQEMAGKSNTEAVSARDQKVIKMITLMSIIFVISFTPDVIVLLFMSVDYRVSFYGQYYDLFLTLHGISEPIIAINASVNIFIYFTMSSKYRQIYNSFPCVKKMVAKIC